MEKDRLSQAIARIDAAAERIAQASSAPAPAPDETALQALRDEIDALNARHAKAIEERDRELAKVRADAADIDKLKDQEIERLRADLANQAEAVGNGAAEAEISALQQKYDTLHAAASTMLSDLDSIISAAERTNNG